LAGFDIIILAGFAYHFALEYIYSISAPFYEKGNSLREIERLTNFAKSSIRQSSIISSGHPLRKIEERQLPFHKTPKFMRSGTIPYGYAYHNGDLVMDPREFKNVQLICSLWSKGNSLKAVART